MSNAVRCEQLFKRYESGQKAVDAVNGLDLEVERGECFGLLGPNGAGKTTTVEILEGLIAATSGEVEVLGMRWGTGRDHELRQKLGITLQETRLRDKLSVLETLRMFRSFYAEGIEAEEAMALVALEEKSNAWISKLSGGKSSASPWHALWSGTRNLSFWTSRPRASILRRAVSCGTWSPISNRRGTRSF